MALNKQIYLTNPTKSRTMGLSDTIRSDAYAYATLYTVLISETVLIRDGVFSISGTIDSPAANEGRVILDISGKEIVLYQNNVLPLLTVFNETFTLASLGLNNIILATGDTIKIKYVYPNALGAYTAIIKSTLFIEDYTA